MVPADLGTVDLIIWGIAVDNVIWKKDTLQSSLNCCILSTFLSHSNTQNSSIFKNLPLFLKCIAHREKRQVLITMQHFPSCLPADIPENTVYSWFLTITQGLEFTKINRNYFVWEGENCFTMNHIIHPFRPIVSPLTGCISPGSQSGSILVFNLNYFN